MKDAVVPVLIGLAVLVAGGLLIYLEERYYTNHPERARPDVDPH